MDEKDGAISQDFVNKLSLGVYDNDQPDVYDDDQPDVHDDGQQCSPEASPFGSMENNGNGFHPGAPDGQADTVDSIQLFSTGFSKIVNRFGKREPPQRQSHQACAHLKPDFVPALKTGRKDPIYSMEHKYRGKCVIINNTYFDSPTLGERKGTQVDRQSLTNCFKQLDFDVYNWDEKGSLDIRLGIDRLAREDFTDHDCLVICVLTHGEQNYLYAKDDKYCVEYLFESFKSDVCKTLAGKPKIFIIQACRGDRLDNGTIINFDVEDSNSADVRIPQWADFLMAYSTVPGFYSWRNTSNGSWFIQAFVAALSEHYQDLDLLSIFTITNQKVAYDFESNTPNLVDFHQRKQIPMIASMLTRKVYFNKPKPRKPPRPAQSSKPSTSRIAGEPASLKQPTVGGQREEMLQQAQRARISEALMRQAREEKAQQAKEEQHAQQQWLQWRQQQEQQKQQELEKLERQKELKLQQEMAEQLSKGQRVRTLKALHRDAETLGKQMVSAGRMKSPDN